MLRKLNSVNPELLHFLTILVYAAIATAVLLGAVWVVSGVVAWIAWIVTSGLGWLLHPVSALLVFGAVATIIYTEGKLP